jgi:hypothetical protein
MNAKEAGTPEMRHCTATTNAVVSVILKSEIDAPV